MLSELSVVEQRYLGWFPGPCHGEGAVDVGTVGFAALSGVFSVCSARFRDGPYPIRSKSSTARPTRTTGAIRRSLSLMVGLSS